MLHLLLSPVTLLGVALISWTIYGVIYRLYLSPIAKFPGPKLAALTLWHEFYYGVIRRGRHPWKVQEMHKKYGPIVRISPYELHVNDPAFFDQLYNSKKFDKYGWHVQQFGHPASSANTVGHEMHKMRRGAIAPYFSRQMILRLEQDTIRKNVEKLCSRIEEYRGTINTFPIGTAYRAFTTDVVTEYTMSKSMGFLDLPDFNEEWFDEFVKNVRLIHFVNQFPWFPSFAKKLPGPIRQLIMPRFHKFVEFHQVVEEIVVKTKTSSMADRESKSNPTVFYEMFNSDMPPEEKTIERITEEGILFVVAGNETTGNALSVMTYHLLANRKCLSKLKWELMGAIPDQNVVAPWQKLEELPYLSAVITEGLRMAFGVVSRMPRVAHEPLYFRDWVIPPDTPVAMNPMDMHYNPEIFPDPDTFIPERWLQPNASELRKYFVPFARGTRGCTGINLAYAELYVTIATVFRRFDFQLWDTTREDVDVAHEFHIPQVKFGSKGVKVRVV